MTIIIDRQTALDLMERAVNDKGADYVYPGYKDGECIYQKDGEPSCLVGHALFYAGVTIEDLALMDKGLPEGDEVEGDSNIRALVQLKGDKLAFEATPAAVSAFVEAQKLQDYGNTWGYALKGGQDAARGERDSL